MPPVSNANYAWILHMLSKLDVNHGVAGFLLANGALNADGDEGLIRREILEKDRVEAIIVLPRDMFYTTDITVTLWIVSMNKKAGTLNGRQLRDRTHEVLFMDLRTWDENVEEIVIDKGKKKKKTVLTDSQISKVTAQFYLAIRSIIYKQTKGTAPDTEIMNAAVEEMVQNAITCTGIENIVDEHVSVDLFSEDFLLELKKVDLPITKFNALLKLLKKAISAYGKINKIKSVEFHEKLRRVVDAYNSRDKLVFTSEVVADFVNDLSDQIVQIMQDLKEDKASFEKMGITYEEKAFYDILVKVRDDHQFPYAEEKCLVLAKKIKELVDDKAQYADWSTRDDIKNQLNMDLTVLLYQNGYPPEWDEEVFDKVMEQAENFKKYNR